MQAKAKKLIFIAVLLTGCIITSLISVQLFSELYPLSVTLTGDSSPLGEPLLKFYFLRFHNQFQRRHNLLYLITNAIKIFINSIIRKSYYCYS